MNKFLILLNIGLVFNLKIRLEILNEQVIFKYNVELN